MPGERTEQATQHRRDKARREGDILHSRELSAAAGTLAGVIALGVLGGRTLEAWRETFAGFLNLGAAACWEPSRIGPTLAAMRQPDDDCSGRTGLGDGRRGRGSTGCGRDADRWSQLSCRGHRIQAGSH